jgi:hypothetical protein
MAYFNVIMKMPKRERALCIEKKEIEVKEHFATTSMHLSKICMILL